MTDPAQLVQRQLDAYNAKDLDAWLSTYAADAEQYELHGALIAAGHDQIRARMAVRFAEPNLHAQLRSRTVMGHIVVDHEIIARTFPEGPGKIEMLCIYEVRGSVIQKATFRLGDKILDAVGDREKP